MEDIIFFNHGNIYSGSGRTFAGLAYASKLYTAWTKLDEMHTPHYQIAANATEEEKNSRFDDMCHLTCPTEDDEIINGIDEHFKLDSDQMEEIIIDIIKFIQKNEKHVEKEWYDVQFRHARDMLIFWRGLKALKFRPSLNDLHMRSLGFRSSKRIKFSKDYKSLPANIGVFNFPQK
jgi:hypothetical protein